METVKSNLDFLRFSAYSIKDLITRKLSQSSQFTDQVYEGSNLTILIDIFSHMAQCLLYSLNNTAAESMFSDTRIYENMNRLIKFLGYNPKGVSCPTVSLVLNNVDASNKIAYEGAIIYKYSVIDTGNTDKNGNKIYYSTDENIEINSNSNFEVLFYNGIWKLYTDILESNETPYQKFVLTDIRSDTENNFYVVNNKVHVYVKDAITGQFEQYKMVDQGLFTDNNIDNGTYIYKSNEAIFNLRLNENKEYEITFGNGFTGKIPSKGSQIYVFYLEGNGQDAELQPYDIIDKTIEHNNSLFGISEDVYNELFKIKLIQTNESQTKTNNLYSSGKWTNTQKSSTYVNEEDVDDIRINAPQWFKTGNRLVTSVDYEYYVKNRFKDNIIDVKCQNNWQYISTFYQWLYNLGLNGIYTRYDVDEKYRRSSFGKYYVNQNRLQKFDLKYADAADGNNVYLWIKMRNDSDVYKDKIDEELLPLKSLTQEAVYLSPLTLYFSPCAADISRCAYYFTQDNRQFDPNNESYIEITIDDNTLYSNNDIKVNIANIIIDFFDESKLKLGQTIDFSTLTSKILNSAAVERIRTIYRNTETGELRILTGLVFATWTSDIIDVGDDIDVSSVSKTLEVFQFPKLYRPNDILEKIKVIKKSISNVNSIQY